MSVDINVAIEAHKQAIDSVTKLEPDLQKVIALAVDTIKSGNTIFSCGNGGSAADAQHFASELTGRYESNRRGYPAIALTTDSSALTSIGNDFGFEQVFSRQLQALGKKGDLLLAISTSGNSKNVSAAVQHAKENGIKTVGLLGRNGGTLAEQVDVAITIPVQNTPRIQEAHILIIHLICEAFEQENL